MKFEEAVQNLSELELDAGIARRLRADVDLVTSCPDDDSDLVQALQRVIRFLEPHVLVEPSTSPEVADPAISAIQSLLDSIYESYLDSSEIAVALENIIKEHNATKD